MDNLEHAVLATVKALPKLPALRPQMSTEIRDLIRRIDLANPLN